MLFITTEVLFIAPCSFFEVAQIVCSMIKALDHNFKGQKLQGHKHPIWIFMIYLG